MLSAALMILGSTKAFLTPPPQQLRTVRRANSLVDDLLRAVDGTDGGVTATAEQKAAILKQIEQLEASYDRAPFDDAENLYRDGTVVYVGQASSKAANAAGGRFRGRIGRTIFRTRGLFQHLIAPDRAVNCVTFRLFGLVDGAAVLTGKVTRAAKLPPRREAQVRDPGLVEDAERIEVGSSGAQSELTQALAATEPGPASRSACLVEFARPRIALGTAVFELGPESSVALDTTYLDERVRVIRGGVSDIPFVIHEGRRGRRDGRGRVAAHRRVRARHQTEGLARARSRCRGARRRRVPEARRRAAAARPGPGRRRVLAARARRPATRSCWPTRRGIDKVSQLNI